MNPVGYKNPISTQTKTIKIHQKTSFFQHANEKKTTQTTRWNGNTNPTFIHPSIQYPVVP